ncbi:MAG: hypothetical protein MK289_17180 [Trichodesmium sp. ALOHA_ZT_67]|nr:hypothetical protein [Trichodesmium sp. ALOHA_ZT_67]MDE5095188.1 hypothetical protein [Trichodesmium sp. St11_bin5]
MSSSGFLQSQQQLALPIFPQPPVIQLSKKSKSKPPSHIHQPSSTYPDEYPPTAPPHQVKKERFK